MIGRPLAVLCLALILSVPSRGDTVARVLPDGVGLARAVPLPPVAEVAPPDHRPVLDAYAQVLAAGDYAQCFCATAMGFSIFGLGCCWLSASLARTPG